MLLDITFLSLNSISFAPEKSAFHLFGSPAAADLVIAFWGGNYSDATLYHAQRVLIPEYILPAVQP